jgi:hypothetical protein
MITTINEYKKINENSSDINNYLNQVHTNEYMDLDLKLYDFISNEGWLEQLETIFDVSYNPEDFEYMTLILTEKDRQGLINNNSEIIEKFNDFDIKLKSTQEYPFDTIDFIDYKKGIVYIIRLV